MHDLCDFALFCLNFHTLLIIFGLTYLLSAPSCQFLFSAVFVFQVFRPLKVLQKIRKNQIKNQRHGSFRKHQRSEGGATTRRPGGSLARPHPRPRQEASWLPGGSPRCPPFAYIYPSGLKPLIRIPFSRVFRCCRRFKIGAAWRSCPGTLPEGETPSGRPSIAMDASRMCRE